jgi:hypothetical protein
MNPLFLPAMADPESVLRLARMLGLDDVEVDTTFRNAHKRKPLLVIDSMQAFVDAQNVIEGEFTVVEPEIGELPAPKEE